ncbi:MAG: MGMT family protein [Thermoanaerobaculia bacterium]|nr:MGMT family protein [Thermoanaerobaculia bacterium]
MSASESAYRRIWAVVLGIPRGRVATYGQVARLAGFPNHARLAGYALHALPDGSPVPWHRVVNAKGEVSPRRDGSGHDRLQRLMLKREKVRFDGRGRISLAAFRWRPTVRP